MEVPKKDQKTKSNNQIENKDVSHVDQSDSTDDQHQHQDFGVNGFQNSLGMKFVTVPITGGKTNSKNILFCVWETRRMDYRKYAEAKNGVDRAWENPDYSLDEAAPVIFVTIRDAESFCDWLTNKERSLGMIPDTFEYRLPTDHEWSCAVEIGELENSEASPILKEGKIIDVYPWGGAWPIPDEIVKIYTSVKPLRMNPVGSFAPNKFGLYDMEGNVSELCAIENKIALGRGPSNADFKTYAAYMDGTRRGEDQDHEFELYLKKRFSSSSRFVFKSYDEEFEDLFANPLIMLTKQNAEKIGASYSATREVLIKRGQWKANPIHGLNDFGFRCVLAPSNSDSSIEPKVDHVVQPLAALKVFKNSTIDEAKECIRLLDEELKTDPENARIKLIKSTIMDVFRAEAALTKALNGRFASEKQYQIKMQNLQIASRPSALTGRVNTAEVERIRQEADEIKTSYSELVNDAKTGLSKSLNSAKRMITPPDSEPLSRVWSQIEGRNNL